MATRFCPFDVCVGGCLAFLSRLSEPSSECVFYEECEYCGDQDYRAVHESSFYNFAWCIMGCGEAIPWDCWFADVGSPCDSGDIPEQFVVGCKIFELLSVWVDRQPLFECDGFCRRRCCPDAEFEFCGSRGGWCDSCGEASEFIGVRKEWRRCGGSVGEFDIEPGLWRGGRPEVRFEDAQGDGILLGRI